MINVWCTVLLVAIVLIAVRFEFVLFCNICCFVWIVCVFSCAVGILCWYFVAFFAVGLPVGLDDLFCFDLLICLFDS